MTSDCDSDPGRGFESATYAVAACRCVGPSVETMVASHPPDRRSLPRRSPRSGDQEMKCFSVISARRVPGSASSPPPASMCCEARYICLTFSPFRCLRLYPSFAHETRDSHDICAPHHPPPPFKYEDLISSSPRRVESSSSTIAHQSALFAQRAGEKQQQ